MQRRKICRYFEKGSCKKENCPFVHLRQNRKNCEFFMQGFCRKGLNCNFYHPPKQSKQEKQSRQQYTPNIEKQKDKQKKQAKGRKQKIHEEKRQYKQEQEQEHDNYNENEQLNLVHAQQKIEDEEQTINIMRQITGQQQAKKVSNNQQRFKMKRINFLLGLGDDSSSQEDQQSLAIRIKNIEENRKKPLNFVKTYPKKFPDYTKTAEIKQKILENQKIYFNGQKFTTLILAAQDPIQKQYLQIIRKFQDSYNEVKNIEEEKSDKNSLSVNITQIINQKGKVFQINVRPILYQTQIMLHFQMTQDYISLRIDSRGYPINRAKFEVLNQSIPSQYKQRLAEYLNKVHKTKSIFDTLKIFINSFEKTYQQIKSKLEDEYFSQIELEEKIRKRLSEEQEKNNGGKGIERKRKKEEKNRRKEASSENPDLEVIRFLQNEKINVGNMNYEISLGSLLLHNAEYVLGERFLLYIQCQCEKVLVHILEADRKQLKVGVKIKCKKCKMIIPIAIQREVLQFRSQLVGRLGIQNGRLLEVGGISWKIVCSCDNQIIKPKVYLPGYRLNANCQQCFKQMQISYMGLKISNPFFKESQKIQNGKQLPLRGACKHMKYSFRWIRYGCCGRAFSCDQCHTIGSIYQHQKIEGITMLCGYCSYEQNLNKQCQFCKKQLVKGIDKSGHWQGGLGCRDKTLLSRKDAKKYTGLTKQSKQGQQK